MKGKLFKLDVTLKINWIAVQLSPYKNCVLFSDKPVCKISLIKISIP